MRKYDFCISENKGADQLCGNREDIYFLYQDSIQSLHFPKFQASSHPLCLYSLVCVGNSEDRFSRDAAHI